MLQYDKEFKDFYYKYFKLAMFSAVNFTKKLPESEELVSDCFLGLWRAWDKMQTEQDRLKYLQRSIKNACINLTAKKQWLNIVRLNESEYDNQWNYAEIHAFFIDNVIKNIDKYIEQLHPRRRQIMRMIMDGVSIQEIATKLGIAVKTVYAVKNLCMPALIKLALR